MPSLRRRFSGSSWCSRIMTTESTTRRNCFWSTFARAPSTGSPRRWTISSVENSPPSIRMARSTSCAAVSSGTFPISLRYIRTGSFVGAFRMSSSRGRRIEPASGSGSRSSRPASTISMPSWRRCSSTCVRKSSTCSGVRSSTGRPSRSSSAVTKPRSRPRAATASRSSSMFTPGGGVRRARRTGASVADAGGFFACADTVLGLVGRPELDCGWLTQKSSLFIACASSPEPERSDGSRVCPWLSAGSLVSHMASGLPRPGRGTRSSSTVRIPGLEPLRPLAQYAVARPPSATICSNRASNARGPSAGSCRSSSLRSSSIWRPRWNSSRRRKTAYRVARSALPHLRSARARAPRRAARAVAAVLRPARRAVPRRPTRGVSRRKSKTLR